MSIDLRRERLLPVKLLTRYAPLSNRTARPPHVSTVLRWCLKGRRRTDGAQVLLECIRTKGGVLSSRAALVRFLAALGEEGDGKDASSSVKSRSMSNASRRARLEGVQRELDAAGI